ncbi:hypothetical protein ACYOEI_08995 [Singulisphaera rosea]
MSEMLALRWILLFTAIVGSFAVAFPLGVIASHIVGVWDEPGAGFVSALAVVLMAYFLAPNYRLQFSVLVFVVGANIAWSLLEPSFLPKSFGDRAYQPTHLPILWTYAGGLLGLLLVIGLGSNRDSNLHPRRKPFGVA